MRRLLESLAVFLVAVGAAMLYMPKLAAKALRALAAHLVQEAEVLQRMAREALAEADRLDKRVKKRPRAKMDREDALVDATVARASARRRHD